MFSVNHIYFPLSLTQMGGGVVMGVGIWTLVDKGDYLSLLASSTFAVSAYILILAGGLVMVTGFLGCCAVIREQRSCLSTVRAHRLMTASRGRDLIKPFIKFYDQSVGIHSLFCKPLALFWPLLCMQNNAQNTSKNNVDKCKAKLFSSFF